MRLELDNEGKLYIRGITDSAWDYITNARKLAGNPWEWYFSKNPYNGDVRVYYNPYNLADGRLVSYLERLEKVYGMQCGVSEKLILESWREACERAAYFAQANKESMAFQKKLQQMKSCLDRGCAHCNGFSEMKEGDDIVGYCVHGGRQIRLDSSPLCMQYGGFGANGMWHLGQKYYPHSGCKYLEIEGEKV